MADVRIIQEKIRENPQVVSYRCLLAFLRKHNADEEALYHRLEQTVYNLLKEPTFTGLSIILNRKEVPFMLLKLDSDCLNIATQSQAIKYQSTKIEFHIFVSTCFINGISL